LGKPGIWSHNKRALSPIFATVLLATIIIIFGSVAYYYATNLTTNATNSYVNTLSNSQQSISERIGFENVVYDQSSSTLKIYIINCGSANNVKIDAVFLYDSSHNIVPESPYSGSSISAMYPIDGGTPTPIAGLNIGKEAYFTVTMTGPSLTSGSIYTIHLITQSGSYFDYEFTP
jgi:archaellum component FlaF (FlaF/FlaG flagellin family)